jgi:chromosome transmission fidelity protein 18
MADDEDFDIDAHIGDAENYGYEVDDSVGDARMYDVPNDGDGGIDLAARDDDAPPVLPAAEPVVELSIEDSLAEVMGDDYRAVGAKTVDVESDEAKMRSLASLLVSRHRLLASDDSAEKDDALWEAGAAAGSRSGDASAAQSSLLMTRPPIDGSPFTVVTLPEGGRYYLRSTESAIDAAPPLKSQPTRNALGGAHLLGEPIGAILSRVRRSLATNIESVLTKARETANSSAIAAAAAENADDADEADIEPAHGYENKSRDTSGDIVPTSLWVDKYSPQNFGQLLSSETVNRNVLRWIKLWDPVVFNRPGPLGAEPVAHEGVFSKRRVDGGGGGRIQAAADSSAPAAPPTIWDLFGPAWNAQAKALLLCGAPGTGKTTLAHIVAAAAGYHVIEVNASDDRGKQSITGLVTNAQTSQRVFGDKRPSLVVLDEVDGMESTAINELVKLLRATPPPLFASRGKEKGGVGLGGGAAAAAATGNREADDDSDADVEDKDHGAPAAAGAGRKRPRAGGGKKSGGASGAGLARLTRPLLLICNDQFAPSLRELKSHVQIVHFGHTASEKLVQRLKSIAAAEGMTIARDALNALVTLNDCDVRSCLNTLQFLKSQVTRRRAENSAIVGGAATGMRVRVTSAMLLSAAVGTKDMSKALTDVWEATFRTPVSQVARVMGGTALSALAAYRESLHAAAGAFVSEAPTLLSGLHENLHSSRVGDPTLRNTVASLDWLCFGEEVAKCANASQTFALLKYVPSAVIGLHLRAASALRFRIAWPKAETTFRGKRDSRVNIVRSFQFGRAAADRAAIVNVLGFGAAALDVISPVITMTMCAKLRPVSFTLANSKDRQLATEVVKVSERQEQSRALTERARRHARLD